METKNKRFKYSNTFSKEMSKSIKDFRTWEQVLLGSLLGDGNLRKRRKSNGDNENDKYPQFREAHHRRQEQYLNWKLNILSQFLNFKIHKYPNHIHIRSLTNPLLNAYYYLFYSNRKKVITREILNMLEPLGIAVWYCDDGSFGYQNNTSRLSTYNYLTEGNKLIIDWFKLKYDINFKLLKEIKKSSAKALKLGFPITYWSIRLNVKDTKKFIELIKPYVPECMGYKLGLDEKRIEQSQFTKKEYYQNHIDSFKKNQREWREKNKEKIRLYKKIYYLTHKKVKSLIQSLSLQANYAQTNHLFQIFYE